MKRTKLSSAVIREARKFNAKNPSTLTSLWGQAVEQITPEDRTSLLFAVAKEIEAGKAAPLCLRPIIEADPLDEIVTNASLYLALLMVPLKPGQLTGPRFVQALALAATDPARAAAIYAGLLLIGDRRVNPLLHQCWRRLDRESKGILSMVKTEVVFASMVDFFHDWVEDVPEPEWGHALAALARLPGAASEQGVYDVETQLPVNSKDGQPGRRILGSWAIPEYGQLIAPRVRALMEREHEPRLSPLVALAWGIIKEDDPALEPGSLLSLLPSVTREVGNPQTDQQEEEKAEQGEVALLYCGGSPCPGIDWNTVVRLSRERPGYYAVWQTNACGRLIKRKSLCGSPPWRLLMTYLSTVENKWCVNLGAPEEFGSSGLEPWQDTALFVCWFRGDGGNVNHGAQFQLLSDEEVQKVCAPYTDPGDWRRKNVVRLWYDLSELMWLVQKDTTIDSPRLKDVLDRLGCWDAPDPVRAAIECLESRAETPNAESCSADEWTKETPTQPPRSWCLWIVCGPQDTRFGIKWSNITERLTLQTWKRKAIVRKASGGWLYLWVTKGQYGNGAVVYKVNTDSEGGRCSQRYERCFPNLEQALAYANGEDDGDIAKETSLATSARDYPPQSEAECHIHLGPFGVPGLKKPSKK
jgi:hypothetical protein